MENQKNIEKNFSKENDCLLKIKYKIPLERYLEFNFLFAEENFAKPRKKAMILGTIEIAVGILFLISILTQGIQDKIMYIVVDLILIAMGTYSVTFYKYFFPRSLKKSALKQYNNNNYLKNEIEIKFYGNQFTEIAEDYKNSIFWKDIFSIKENENLYMIMIDAKRCVLIPKEMLGDQLEELDQFFTQIAENFEKKRITL